MTKTNFKTKQEVLNYLDSVSYYNNGSGALIKKIIAGTDENDLDFAAALKDGMVIQIVDLFLDCYSSDDLLTWLADHDYDLFSDYRYAEVVYRDDYESDEDMKENSDAFYNGEPDCLMVNEEDGVYVVSW